MNFNPAIIGKLAQSDQSFSVLETVPLDKPPYNEDWLQNLIHDNPGLIPSREIEACFDNLVPVLREFSLPSGYLDNFYVTPEGYPVLVEVKLWKNQEARRKVVAQILEYAKDFAALSYEDLNREITKQLKTQKWGQNPLYEILSAHLSTPPDEATFVDRVARNLREGRFLLLVLGDGIREEMAALAGYLMQHSLRYAFGMVEIRLFKLPDGSHLALPRVLAKTQTIERHVTVVTTQGDGIKITASAPVISERVEKTSLSSDEFYDLMAKSDPQNVMWVKELIAALSDLPIDVQIGSKAESLMFKAPAPDGSQIQFMLFTPTNVQFWGVPNKNWKDPAWQRLSMSWLERIAVIAPGSSIKTFNSAADIKHNDKQLPISMIRGKTNDLADAIRQVILEIDKYYDTQGVQVGD